MLERASKFKFAPPCIEDEKVRLSVVYKLLQGGAGLMHLATEQTESLADHSQEQDPETLQRGNGI